MFGHEHVGAARELLVGEIHKAVSGATPLSAALGELARLTGADKAFWGHYDLDRRSGRFLDSSHADPKFVERYNAGASAQNVWLARAQYFQAPGLIWLGSKIVAPDDLAASAFYKEFLEPQQIFHTMHIVLAVDGPRVTHVMLTRPRHELDFRETEIAFARCFALHAREAIESQQPASRLKTMQSCLSDLIDDAGLSVAVVDPPTLVYASAAFEAALRAMGGSALRNGALNQRAQQIHFPRPLADAIASHDFASVTPLVLERPNRDGRWLAVIKPFPLRSGEHPEGRKALSITLHALDRPIVVDEALLRSVYNLTASEAQICALLANGERVEDLSEKLKISPNTARTHIKRIYSKTASRRQTDLMRLLLRTASRTQAPAAVEERARRRPRRFNGGAHGQSPAPAR